MKKSLLVIFAVVISLGTSGFAVDDVTANGAAIIIQAEDCVITALSGGYTVAGAPSQWQAQGEVVSVSTGIGGGLDYGYGDIKFALAGAIPDGDYTLSVKWHTAAMSGEAWAFMIGAQTGTVAEGSYESGGWHYFYPGRGGAHSDQWFTDDLAGTDGLTFETYSITPIRPYLSLSGIGNNDLYIRIADMAPGENNYFAIDYFVLQPVTVTNKLIHVEAEDCTITAGAANSYWRIDDQWVYVATSSAGNSQSATGNVAFHLPGAIADGQYIVRMGYRLGTWLQQSAAFKIAPASGSSGTIIENAIPNQNDWHIFYPDGYALYQIDELAGLAGLSFPISGATPISQSVTVSNISAGEFVIYIWDQSGGNYNFFGIDFFELIPVAQ